jgi:enamine deaminase RidA (YjgF/YER057c/UK114 family)
VFTNATEPTAATARSFLSNRSELCTIFGSSLARLIRYEVWMTAGSIPAARRFAAKLSSAAVSIGPTRYVLGFPLKNCSDAHCKRCA